MPTPESAEAFRKLVATRERLAEVTKRRTAANAELYMSREGTRRYEALQAEWDEAFRQFQEATVEFSEITKKLMPEGVRRTAS